MIIPIITIHLYSMEQKSFKTLPFKTIGEATEEAVSYIEKRKNHEIDSLCTRWPKFNNLCMGKLVPLWDSTISGISGGGKSSFVNTLETDLIDLNPDREIVVLSFNFEMIASRQVGRKLSYKLKETTSTLYSAVNSVDDQTLKKVKAEAEKIKKYPVYYIDTPATVEKIGETIEHLYNIVAKGKWLVIILDHTLLVNGEGKDERSTVIDLQKLFMQVKKKPNVSIIQISQMNRNIESSDRINNPSGHYPMRSDLSSSDAIFQASDYVIAIHRPELYGIKAYGIKRLPVTNKVYMHFLKIRDGEPKILEFDNELKYGNLIENIVTDK